MSAGETPRFGRLGLLPLVARSCRPTAPAVTPGCLDKSFDEEIIEAFKAVGRGMARDRLLADPELAQKFVRKARCLGVAAPPAHINRRLLRLGKKGGVLPETTERVTQSSIDDHNVFAIEFGVVRIAHLYGATVDDILCEPLLGDEFHRIVEAIAPGYPALVYRLGALFLRKTRNLQRAKKREIEGLDPNEMERSWVDLGTVAEIKTSSLAKFGPGILHLDEGNRSLYIAKTESIAELASTFLKRRIWEGIGNHFWHPDRSHIHMKVLPQSALGKLLASWLLRLIQSLEPVFNIKVDKEAA